MVTAPKRPGKVLMLGLLHPRNNTEGPKKKRQSECSKSGRQSPP